MLPTKNLIANNMIAFSIITMATGCSKSYQSQPRNDLSLSSLSKVSNKCLLNSDENLSQEEMNNIKNVKEFFQPGLSAEEQNILNEALIQYYKRENNESEPIAHLLYQLEDYMHKYSLKLDSIHARQSSFIEEFITEVSDTYINTIDNINKIEESSIIKYKNSPVYGALKNEDFSIEKYFLTLEAEEKVSQFKSIIKNHLDINNLSEDYIPLPDTFKTGGMIFINKRTGEEKLIPYNSDEDLKFLNHFRKYLNENISRISPFVKRDSSGQLHLKEINSAFGLRAGIGIKTIFDFMADKRKGHSLVSEDNDSNLITMLKVHTYINLTQIGIDSLSELDKISKFFETINNSSLVKNAHFYDSLSGIGEKISLGLNSANIILDALELANAENATQKIQFGTELGFDTAGFSIGVTSSILSLLGEATASTSLSALSVPFAGLALGLNAFANAAAYSQEGSIHLANYFYMYEQELSKYIINPSTFESDFHKDIFSLPVVPLAYKNWNYRNNKFETADYTNVMIKEVDLSTPNQVKLHFGDHYVYQTSRYEDLDPISHTYVSSFGPSPNPIMDSQHLLPIKNLLNFSLGNEDSIILDKIKTSKPIILPIVPTTDISYNFNYTPGILSRHDAELSSVLKMQKYGKFIFEYMTGIFTEFAIRELAFDYKNTEISIKLGENNRFLFTPLVPDHWKDLITYNIYGNKGHYFLKTANDVNYSIHSNTSSEKWIIDVSSVNNNIKIENNRINLGNNYIQFSSDNKPKEILLLHANGSISSIQLEEEKQKYISYDYSKLNMSVYNFKNMLHSQSIANNQSEGYIEIENYPIDSINKQKSWYDIKRNVIISPFFPNHNNFYMLGKVGDYFYFYDHINFKIYYLNINKNETFLLENDVKNIQMFSDHIIVEKLGKYIISIIDPRKKTLLEIITPKMSKKEIHKVTSENGYKINNEVLLFNQDKKFLGWYLSNTDILVDIEKVGNHIKDKSE